METPGNTGIPVCIVFLIQSFSDLVFVCISHSNLYSGLVFELCFCLRSSQDVTDDRPLDFDRNNFLCYISDRDMLADQTFMASFRCLQLSLCWPKS